MRVVAMYIDSRVTTKECFSVNSKNKTQKWGKNEEGVKNIILVKKMSMKCKSGMLRIPPGSMFYVGNTLSGPLPLPTMFSCTFEAR